MPSIMRRGVRGCSVQQTAVTFIDKIRKREIGLRIEQLAYFLEVVKAGSVNAASKKTFISQQSLNKSIRSMENEFGFPLFKRNKHGVVLTEKGKIVFSAIQAMMARWDQMQEEIEDASTVSNFLSGDLTIHTSPMVSISLMPIAYIEYMHQFPQVKVYCQEKYRDDIVATVADNPGDVGYILMPNSIRGFKDKLPAHVEMRKMAEYPIYMAMSPKHPLAQQRSLSFKSMEAYPLIVYESGGPQGLHAYQNEGDFHVILSTNNYKMCEELLCEGASLVYSYPPYLAHNIFPSCVHVPVGDKRIFFELYLVYNKNSTNEQRQLINTFSQVLQQYL